MSYIKTVENISQKVISNVAGVNVAGVIDVTLRNRFKDNNKDNN